MYDNSMYRNLRFKNVYNVRECVLVYNIKMFITLEYAICM